MATPRQFERSLLKIAERVERNAERTVVRAATAGLQVAVTTTPVDTGQARNGWQAEIDRPAEGVPPVSDRDGNGAIARARSVINQFRARINRAIHLTNNVEYIRSLDEGSSAQAPQGMSRQAAAAAGRVIREARLLRE